MDRKIGTIDIETYVGDNGCLIPYAIGSYIGGPGNFIRHKDELKMYYLTDYKHIVESEEKRVQSMLLDWLKDILLIKNRGYKLYAHNLSNFDGPLLIKYLSSIEWLEIKPLIRESKIYSIDITIDVSKMDDK